MLFPVLLWKFTILLKLCSLGEQIRDGKVYNILSNILFINPGTLHNIFMKRCPNIPNSSKDTLKLKLPMTFISEHVQVLTMGVYLESSRTFMMEIFLQKILHR